MRPSCITLFLLLSAIWVTPAGADIDVSLRPTVQTATVGDVISIDVVASSDDASTQLLTAAEVVFTWDPAVLELLDSIDDCALLSCPPGPNCLGSSFPLAAAINEANPPADGDGMVQILANPIVGPIPAPPQGRILTTLDFLVLAPSPTEAVDVVPAIGLAETVVYGPGILVDVTGTLAGAKVVVPDMATMLLTADPPCATPGELVDVTLRLEDITDVLTYQARLSFDSARLSFISGTYIATVFETAFVFPIAAAGEDIDVSAGSFDGATSADQDVVVLTFEALVDGCVTGVIFRDTPPDDGSFVADAGGEVPTLLKDLLPVDDGDPCTDDLCDCPSLRVCHPPVDCSDGDPCTMDTCDPAGGCQHQPIDCDDGLACTVDTCVAGGCMHTANDAACDDGNECVTSACDPLAAGADADGCVDTNLPPGSACGDPTNTKCNPMDTCNGAGVCLSNFLPAGTTCGDDTDTECDDPDTCDGAGACQDNPAASGTACGDPTDGDCDDPDICDGAGACQDNPAASGTACGDPTDGDCNDPDTCDGAGNCDANLVSAGTGCPDDGNSCTGDVCNGSGMCTHPPTAAGVVCDDDGDLCTIDHCDGAGSCVQTGTVSCADSTGPCDGGESCDPASGMCVAVPDPLLSTPCNDDGDLCTIDHCDGAGNCVLMNRVDCLPTQECNPDNGRCEGCLIGDMNSDGLCTVLFDAELFEQCVYDLNCDGPAPGATDLLCPADCNCDGMATIIPDAECFVENNYVNNECGICPLDQSAPEPGTIGGAVYQDPTAKLNSGLANVPVMVTRNGHPVARTHTDELGLWKITDLPDGAYKVIFGNDRRNAIVVVVSAENQAQNLSITRLYRDASRD